MRGLLVVGASGIASILPASNAFAQVAVFEVDPTVSSLSASGTVAGAPIQEQGPGSLTTTYAGPLHVQLSQDSISFPGGSFIKANDSGVWQPAPGGVTGSAPANYGGRATILFVTVRAALRDAVFDATSDAAIPFSNGTFNSSGVTITGLDGQIDYNAGLAGQGSDSIVGASSPNESPNPGTLTITPGPNETANAAIYLPLEFTIATTVKGVGDVLMDLDGSMTARANAVAGDANFDGVVNLADFNTLAANFGATSGQNWLSGDFNFDGQVNLADFNLLASNFGLAATGEVTPADWAALASAIPEPALSCSGGLVALWALQRRRR